MKIQNRILKTELIEWRKLKELQPKGFKELSKINYDKLKASLLNNNFAMPFTVWQSKDDIFIIDGHHRYKVLDLLEKDGIEVPEKLPCNFIECANRKEASKLVLMYSSIYANVQEEGLYEFMNIEGLDFESIKAEFDIPSIDFEKFELGYFKEQDEEKLNDVPELQEKAVSKLGDLFLIDGKHRVLCGDSTKEESYKVLFEGKKADMVFTSPPYAEQRKDKYNSINTDKYIDWFSLIAVNIYNILSADGSFFLNIKEHCENGERHLYCKKLLIHLKEVLNYKFIDEFIWKHPAFPGKFGNRFKNGFEPVYHLAKQSTIKNINHDLVSEKSNWKRKTNPRQITGNIGHDKPILQNNVSTPDNVIECNVNHENLKHPAMFPVNLPKFFIKAFTNDIEVVCDIFLGSGTTLIACEQTNRICYGIELDEHYIDVILRRYKKLYPDAKFECLNRKFDFKELFDEKG